MFPSELYSHYLLTDVLLFANYCVLSKPLGWTLFWGALTATPLRSFCQLWGSYGEIDIPKSPKAVWVTFKGGLKDHGPSISSLFWQLLTLF